MNYFPCEIFLLANSSTNFRAKIQTAVTGHSMEYEAEIVGIQV